MLAMTKVRFVIQSTLHYLGREMMQSIFQRYEWLYKKGYGIRDRISRITSPPHLEGIKFGTRLFCRVVHINPTRPTAVAQAASPASSCSASKMRIVPTCAGRRS